MTTEEIINDMRSNTITSMRAAADRLEELSKLLKSAKLDNDRYQRELMQYRFPETSYRPDYVRKDPSRLEIAAMIYAAGIASNQFDLDGEANLCGDALNHADALIAEAKEGK